MVVSFPGLGRDVVTCAQPQQVKLPEDPVIVSVACGSMHTHARTCFMWLHRSVASHAIFHAAWMTSPSLGNVCACVCAPVTASGELYSWGWAEHGNLGTHACVCRGVDVRPVLMNTAPVPPTGLGTTENQFTPRLVHTPAPVVSVTAGGAAVFALCASS